MVDALTTTPTEIVTSIKQILSNLQNMMPDNSNVTIGPLRFSQSLKESEPMTKTESNKSKKTPKNTTL
jgi:hypothetical protein